MERDPFQEYLRQTEPKKRDKGKVWSVAIGLQAVDGLKPSRYLVETAIQNIEGRITLEEAQGLLDTYYEENRKAAGEDERIEEADKVSVRIARLLSEKAFSFTPNEYLSIHKNLFGGIYGHAGKFRDYNITKKEWVLDGATVLYGSASELRATLEYDLSQEKNYSYKGLSEDEIIRHLAVFVARLWQIHVFGEGNTRTTAVFFIKYLRTLGYEATNDIFAENAWYFRNALVRANYNDLKKDIHETTEYLELFLRNLLLHEKNILRNRTMHVSGRFVESPKADIEIEKADIGSEKPDIGTRKPDIGAKKPDIDSQKPDIHAMRVDVEAQEADKEALPVRLRAYEALLCAYTAKTNLHVREMYEAFGKKLFFGRADVQAITGLKTSRASELLKTLLHLKIIEPVKGHGKGKYRFAEGWEDA